MRGSIASLLRSLWSQQLQGVVARNGSRRSSRRFAKESGQHRRRVFLERLEDRRLLTAVPTITIDDVQQLEGDDATSIVFTVTRSGKSNLESTVQYTTADSISGTAATAGDDYESAIGTLVFAPGEKTKTIVVTVNGDLNSETDEEFFVNLSNPTNAKIGDDQGLATIENDDNAPVQNTIYVYSLTYETRQRGPHTEVQFTIDVRIDSDNDGESEESDARAVGVVVVLSVYESASTDINGDSNIRNFLGTLDEGIGKTYWYKLPGPGDYHIEVQDLSLAGYYWDPFDVLESGLDDEDEDGRPDLVLTVL